MRAAPQFRPVGHGLDAIVFLATHPRTWWERLTGLRARSNEHGIRPLSDADRLDRYHDAALLRPMYRDPQLLDLREHRGRDFLKAWRSGWFPKVNRIRHLKPVPSITQSRRASRACG